MNVKKLLVHGLFFTACALPVNSNAVTVAIDTATRYQSIDGFGWHGMMDVWWGPGPFFNDKYLALVIDTLGLTINRNEFYPPGDPCCNPPPAAGGCWDKQLPSLKALQAKAIASGEPLVFFYSLWTPPPFMKTNNSHVMGSLKPEQYKALGAYMVDAIKKYKSEGLAIYAVSPQNEPDVTVGYNSCFYTRESFVAMFKVIGPVIKEAYPDIKLLAPEHFSWTFPFPDKNWDGPLLADPDARKYWDIEGFHDYQDQNAGNILLKYSSGHTLLGPTGLRVWQTENGTTDNSIGGAITFARSIWRCLNLTWANAYVYWQGSGGTTSPNNFSIITTNMAMITKRFYMLRQFYRFIRPGAVRIKAELTTADNTLLSTAFVRKVSGKEDNWAIVLINTSTSNKDITLSGAGIPATFDVYQTDAQKNSVKLSPMASNSTLTLPGLSITTLTSGDFHGGINIMGGASPMKVAPRKKAETLNSPLNYERRTNGLMIHYTLSKESNVLIRVVSYDGKTIAVPVNSKMGQGRHSTVWVQGTPVFRGAIASITIDGTTRNIPIAPLGRS